MRIITFIVVVMCFPFVTFASATNSGYSEEQAQAFFSSVQGCEDVVVGVSVVEPESIKPKAPLVPTEAFIFGSFNNICDIGSSYAFAGVVSLDSKSFGQKGLNSAILNFAGNINGFDVAIALNWDGIGKIEKSRNKIRILNDLGMVHDSDVIAFRASDINGTFIVNGINYAVGTLTGGLNTIRAHTVQIEK